MVCKTSRKMSEALDPDSPILSQAESFSDFLEGFKSARMSFEPLESWLFGPKSKNVNEELDATSKPGKALENHWEDIERNRVSHEVNDDSDDNESDARVSHYSDSENESVLDFDDEKNDKACESDEDVSELCDDGEHVDEVVEVDENTCDDICHFNGSLDECSDDETNESPLHMTSSHDASQLLSENCSAPETLDRHSIGKYDLPINEFENVVYRRRKMTHREPNYGNSQAGIYKTPKTNIYSLCTDEYPIACYIAMPSSESGHRTGGFSQNHCDISLPLSQEFLNIDSRVVLRNLSNDEGKAYAGQLACYQKCIGELITSNLPIETAGCGASELDKTAKRARMRNMIAHEILDTEKTYHRHLELIVKHFESPLREAGLISDQAVSEIFGNIRQIIGINDELMKRLQTMNIGEAFLLLGPFLKLYSTYANNHERALATLMNCEQKHPDFAQFRRHQEQLSDMNGLKLNALLITPVQRVPRYKLLLSELLEHTPSQDPDHKALTEAVSQISAVASHINDHIKQQDNFMRMFAIQRSLACPVGPQILVPGRVFVKEGQLRKVSKRGSFFRSYERTFFLFSDVLMYAKPRLIEGPTSGGVKGWASGGGRCSASSPSLVCCCIMPLHHCHVERLLGHPQGNDEQGSLFTVTCKQESLMLYSDQKTVNAWIDALSKTISECRVNRQTLRRTSSAKKPVRRSGITRLWKAEKRSNPLRSMVGSPDKTWSKSSNLSGSKPTTPRSPGGSLLSRFIFPSSKHSPSASTKSRKRHFGLNLGCLSSPSERRPKLGKRCLSPCRVASPDVDI